MNRPPLPVVVLTGFLGSGKTTLLRRLLASPQGRRIGILMNERGLLGVEDVAGSDAGFVELAEGCVCCVDQPDLAAALGVLEASGRIDRIVLETSGLADPLPIAWSLATPALADRFLLEAVLAVVDAAHHDEASPEEWSAQLRSADLVLVGKRDLVDEATRARAERRALAVNPGARLLLEEEAVLALAGADALFALPCAQLPLDGSRPAVRHGEMDAISFAERAAFDADAIEDLIEDLPVAVFRAKGVVQVGDGRWISFQAVGGRAHIDLDAAPPAHGESRLVFFGRRLERRALEASLDACRPRTPAVVAR